MEIKVLFGSKMLGLDNSRDEDWVIFIEKHPKGTRKLNCRSIEFHKNYLKRFLNGCHQTSSLYRACFLYQMSCGFHNEEYYPFKDFNILEHKNVWVEQLKGYMNLPEAEQVALSEDVLPKRFYNILYQYYMMLENTHWISDEAKADVQKIHDLEMPSSYFYELRDLINSL